MILPYHHTRTLHRLRPVAPKLATAIAVGLLAVSTGCAAGGNSEAASTTAVAPDPAAPVPAKTPLAAVKAKASKTNSKAVAFNDQGVKQLSKGDFTSALKHFNQAIQADPKLAEAYLGRGITYSGLRKRQEALKDFNQAINLNPNFAEAYLNRADEYAAMGKREVAIADFDKAAKLFSQQGNQGNMRLTQARLEALKDAAPPMVAAKPAQTATSATATTPTMALAMHLRNAGAKMYGTFWCSVCNWQQEQFGKEAFNQITYVECDPNGSNPQPNLCNQANIRAYPTWEINGRLYEPGGLPLGELADLSNYQGPRNF